MAALASLSGCVSTETVRKEPERLKVEFENEETSRIFNETLNRMPAAHDRRESSFKFHIPILLRVSRTVIVSENAAFNDAVRQCDRNQDGKITKEEAQIFSERQSR